MISLVVNLAQVASGRPALRISPSQLQRFEPLRLGPLEPKFQSVLRSLAGLKQSQIIALLEREVADIDEDAGEVETNALRVSLLVLRDYVATGHYPLVRDGRCFLVNTSDPAALSVEQQRSALQYKYRAARERALRDRGALKWLQATAAEVSRGESASHSVVEALRTGPPTVLLADTRDATVPHARDLWRAVRATWTMGPEASAPGRESSFLVLDERWQQTPLGILQFRNVVPEISARDAWLGTAVVAPGSSGDPGGFIGLLYREGDVEVRARATLEVLQGLLANVRREGVGIDFSEGNIAELGDFAREQRRRFNETRSMSGGEQALKNMHLRAVKRAQTAAELLKGIRGMNTLLGDRKSPGSLAEGTIRDIDSGLSKIWHYHMGFVALEMSICGAAPPFGAQRVGKLMAALAGSREVVKAWGGAERGLGAIAQEVYEHAVRQAVPNLGPLVVFTSGLFPGHSAQYNRVRSGDSIWRKIGETSGYGSFHISPETTDAMRRLNHAVEGYESITRTFGEGSGARFRSVGRALGLLGLPDFRNHEIRRPLYALPLVSNPQAALLGWESPKPFALPSAADVGVAWWHRWVEPHANTLAARAASSHDLTAELFDLIAGVRALDAR